MKARGIARAAAPWAAALLAAGCTTRPVPQSHFYRLDAATPPAAATAAPRFDGVLSVERFTADDLVRERPIVYSDGTALEVQQHHYHYWVEPPTDMLQEQMAAYLRAEHVATTVVTPEMRIRPDYVVLGRLNRFERVLADGRERVVVDVRLSLKDEAHGRVVWTDTYHVEEPVEGDDVGAAVAAFNRATGDVLARFAADLARR